MLNLLSSDPEVLAAHAAAGGDLCLDTDGSCRVCGASLDACPACSGIGYHRAGCAESDGDPAPRPEDLPLPSRMTPEGALAFATGLARFVGQGSISAGAAQSWVKTLEADGHIGAARHLEKLLGSDPDDRSSRRVRG